jgi:hypothetical protein
MGKYLGKTKHKKVKKYNNISRRIQRGGTLTSEKINYIMDIIKKYSKRDLGGIKGIVSIDSKKNKVAASITDENIKKVLTMIQTMKPQQITEHIEKLRTEENPISLTRANTELDVDSRHTGIPFRYGDATIPDVGSTEDYSAHRRPAGRVRPGSPLRLPSSFDTTESHVGPWALSVADPSHILPPPRPGARRVVHPPAPALPRRLPPPPFTESFLKTVDSTDSVTPSKHGVRGVGNPAVHPSALPRHLPPPPFTESFLGAFDSTESVTPPKHGVRGVGNPAVHPPAPAPALYSHDAASLSAVSSPRRHRRAAAHYPSVDIIPPSSHAPSELYNSIEYLSHDPRSKVAALRNKHGAVGRADFVEVPPGFGVRGRGANPPSPTSSRSGLPVGRADFVEVPPGFGVRGKDKNQISPIASPLAVDINSYPSYDATGVLFPASPIALRTNPEMFRSINESRKGAVAPPVSRDVSQLSPRASNASMASQLSIPGRGRGSPPHSELDTVRYDTGSSVAPLPRSHSQPSSALNLMDSSEQDQYPWERPGAAFIPEIPPPKSASAAKLPSPSASAAAARLPSAPASAAKAASPKSVLSPQAKKQEQNRAWVLGMFDSTAEQVARPDTEEFDFTKSVQNSPLAYTPNAKPSMFGSEDFSSLFSTPKQHVVIDDQGPAMFSNRDELLRKEFEEAEQRIIDDEIRDKRIQAASNALKAKGDEILRKRREEKEAREQAQAALKQQRRDDKEAKNRENAARIEKLEKIQIQKRTPQQQMELNSLKLSYDDDDDDDLSGGGRRRTRRIRKRGRRCYKIKKSRKNKRNIRSKRSGRK